MIADEAHRRAFLEEFRVGGQAAGVSAGVVELREREADDVQQEYFALDESAVVVVHRVAGVEHHQSGSYHIYRAVHAGVALVEANYCDFVFLFGELSEWKELAVGRE